MSSWTKDPPSHERTYDLYSVGDPSFQMALQKCHNGPIIRSDLHPLNHNNPADTQRWYQYMNEMPRTYTHEAIQNNGRRLDHMLTMAWASVNLPPGVYPPDFDWLYPLHQTLTSSYAALYSRESRGSQVQGYGGEEVGYDREQVGSAPPPQFPAARPALPAVTNPSAGTGQMPFNGVHLRANRNASYPRYTICAKLRRECSGVMEGQQAGQGMRCHRCRDDQQCEAELTKPPTKDGRPDKYGRGLAGPEARMW